MFSPSFVLGTVSFRCIYTLIWAKGLGRSHQGIIRRLAVRQFDFMCHLIFWVGFMKSRQRALDSAVTYGSYILLFSI